MTRSSLALLTMLLGCPKGPDDTAPDTDDSVPGVAQCPLDALVEGDFRIDVDGPLAQIHPSAAWDGEAVWVAYVLPEPGTSYFDIWATRVGVDGQVLVAPFQVDGGEGYSETYARVAVSDGRVVVAWQADNGTGVDNMDLGLRSFTRDGSELDAAPVMVEPMVGGTPQTANGWMPALAADAQGGFALAGAWGLDSVSTFQAVLLELDADGAVAADGLVPELDGEQSHYYPSVATGPGGERALAWESWTASAGTAVHVGLVDGAGVTTLASFSDHDEAGLPFVAWERAADGLPYLAYYSVEGSEYDIQLAGGELAGAPVLATLGQAGKIEHTPIIAAGEHGAVVAWMRNISGLSNQLVLQPARLDGDAWALGDELVLHRDRGGPLPARPHLAV